MAKRAQIDAVRPVLTALDKEVTAVEHVLDAIESGADKATDVLESGLEKVADVVPEALDKSVHVAAEVTRRGVRGFRNPKTMAITIVLLSAAAGAGLGVAGYYMMKRRMETKYQAEFEARLDTELDTMREFYMRRNKAGEYATPRTAAEALMVSDAVEALETYTGEKERPFPDPKVEDAVTKGLEEMEPGNLNPAGKIDYTAFANEETVPKAPAAVAEAVQQNVFVNGSVLVPDDWDAEQEEASRSEESPYVISYREYMENSFQHEQTELTYYKGDDVLTDAKQDMVTEVESTVGTDNLGRFGHGSMDSNTVYVRNERLELDFQVSLNDGSFGEQVMGLRHSNDAGRQQRRARWGDDG